MTKSTEQLSNETDTLFNKMDEQRQMLHDLKLQSTKIEGRMDSLVELMQSALTHLPSAHEYGVKYNYVCDRVDKIEKTYVTKEQFTRFEEDFKSLRKNLWGIAVIFIIPIVGIAVKLIFGDIGV